MVQAVSLLIAKVLGCLVGCPRRLWGFFYPVLLIHLNLTRATMLFTFLPGSLTTRVLLAGALETFFGASDTERTEDNLTYLIPAAFAFIFLNSSSRCNFCHFSPLNSLRCRCRFSICSRSHVDTLRTGMHFLSYFFLRGWSRGMVQLEFS